MSTLYFERMNARRFQIHRKLNLTCEWLLQHELYVSWLDDARMSTHNGFMWLKGKPGAGKSTVMRFAFDEHCTGQHVGQHTCSPLIASFFFHARGESLQHSVEGMYRSLIHQLLKGYPDLQQLLDSFEFLPSNEEECPSLSQLQELLHRAISRLRDRQLICYVDALDECDVKEVASMVQAFQELAEEHNKKTPRLRVFFSSRHYPHIEPRIGLQIELDSVYEHTEDMKRYVRQRLNYRDSGLQERITQRAKGVFMWVVLVVDILNNHQSDGLPLSTAGRVLNQLPEHLSELFGEILKRHEGNTALFVLASIWILYAERPLTPNEFEHALWADTATDLSSCPPVPDSGAEDQDRLRRRVISATKGLAEVNTQTGTPVVQFIHESVRDFLLRDEGLAMLWAEGEDSLDHASHERLKRCCDNYLGLHSVKGVFSSELTQATSQRSFWMIEYPFLKYAAQFIMNHAEHAGRQIPQVDFLRTFSIPSWIRIANVLSLPARYLHAATDMLHLLTSCGYQRLVAFWSEALVLKCESLGPLTQPSLSALEQWHTRVSSFPSLYRRYRELHPEDAMPFNGAASAASPPTGCGQTLLSWAAEECHHELVKVLLLTGATANELDSDGYTALARAVLGKGEWHWGLDSALGKTIGVLLDHGAYSGASIAVFHDRPEAYNSEQMDELFAAGLGEWAISDGRFDVLYRVIRKNRFRTMHPWVNMAARKGHLEAVQYLIGCGFSVNIPLRSWWRGESYRTPLVEALCGDHYAVADQLLSSGADIWAQKVWEESPFWIAVLRDSEHLLDWLTARSSRPDWHVVYGNEPLVTAVEHRSRKSIGRLLATGADMNRPNSRGETALMKARERGGWAEMELLAQHEMSHLEV